MTNSHATQPVSLDDLTRSMVPVVLGGPSLRSAEPRHSRRRRSMGRVPAGSVNVRRADQDRLTSR